MADDMEDFPASLSFPASPTPASPESLRNGQDQANAFLAATDGQMQKDAEEPTCRFRLGSCHAGSTHSSVESCTWRSGREEPQSDRVGLAVLVGVCNGTLPTTRNAWS